MENISHNATTINLNKVCRACLLEYEEMHSIFSEIQNEDNLEEQPTYLCEILMSISAIRVLTEDGLPSTVCTTCMELAHTSYKFQQQCNRSQEILEAYTIQLQNKEFDLEGDDEDVTKGASEDALEYLQSNLTVAEESEVNVSLDHSITKLNLDKVYPENVMVKNEINEEQTLDAVKVAMSEDNMRLRQRLAMKRLKTEYSAKKKNLGVNYSTPIIKKVAKFHECNYCEKSYKHANSLKIHLRTHTMERPYVCKHCGKSFKQYGALTYHLRSHTGEQPYGCKICGKRYRQSGTLTAHMRVHTGQKPFLCSVCGRGFRQAPDLGYHMRTHTKERPYMCNVCGKTMRMQCHLVQHMRIHTGEKPFKCTECNKAFPSSTRLKRHAIIHTGLKPYSCDVCSKSFNRLSSLRVHAKIHTDERPHVCSVCGKGFIQAHALRGHMHSHASADTFYKNT